MGWVLQLVETGTDSRTRSVEVLEISRPNDLGDIANLGLTLPEAKQVLARVQQAVVAAQAHDHAVPRPDCSSCRGSRRCSAQWRCGSRGFAGLWWYRDLYQLAIALSADAGAGSAASAS